MGSFFLKLPFKGKQHLFSIKVLFMESQVVKWVIPVVL